MCGSPEEHPVWVQNNSLLVEYTFCIMRTWFSMLSHNRNGVHAHTNKFKHTPILLATIGLRLYYPQACKSRTSWLISQFWQPFKHLWILSSACTSAIGIPDKDNTPNFGNVASTEAHWFKCVEGQIMSLVLCRAISNAVVFNTINNMADTLCSNYYMLLKLFLINHFEQRDGAQSCHDCKGSEVKTCFHQCYAMLCLKSNLFVVKDRHVDINYRTPVFHERLQNVTPGDKKKCKEKQRWCVCFFFILAWN